MAEAGLGSITKLQGANNPAKVLEVLNGWLALGSAPPSSKQSFIEGEKKQSDSQLLMPVAHTIWRDLLAFIPVYSILIFLGAWVFLSFPWKDGNDLATKELSGLLHFGSPAFWLALALTLVIALADYIEDSIHLYYLKIFPRAPAAPLVYTAYAATVLKFVLFIVGFLIFVLALGKLTVLEAPKVLTPASGAIRALLVFGPALLLVLSLILKLRARKSKGEDGVQTPTAVPRQLSLTRSNKKQPDDVLAVPK